MNLVHVATAFGAAHGDNAPVKGANRDVYRKFGIFVQKFTGVAGVPDVSHEHGPVPDAPYMAPFDNHGINLAIRLCGDQNAVFQSMGNVCRIIGNLDFSLCHDKSPMLNVPCAFSHQLRALLESFLAFLREHVLVTDFLGIGIKKVPGPVCLAVVLKLERISANKRIGRADKAVQRLPVVFDQARIVGIRGVACQNEQDRNGVRVAAVVFNVVRKVLEYEPLVQRPEGCRNFGQVVGRADNQAVRFANGIQHGRKAVPANAVPLVFLLFAPEAGDAAGVFFQAKKVEPLDGRPLGLCPSGSVSQERVCVPTLTRARVYDDDIFHRKSAGLSRLR